jgi:hypothetical protein
MLWCHCAPWPDRSQEFMSRPECFMLQLSTPDLNCAPLVFLLIGFFQVDDDQIFWLVPGNIN